jgi:hypothetical protein
MRGSLEKYVPDFSEKFKLAKLALVRSGQPLELQKSYAWLVFPHLNDGSALSQLSSCITGKRPFPVDRLETLLVNFDRRGVLKGVTTSIWLGSLASFTGTLLSLGLIDKAGCEFKRLAEKLADVESTNDAITLLENYAHTFETSNEFELSLQLLSADDKRKVAVFFCQVIEGSWGADGRRLRSAMVAGAILARIWPSLARLREMSRLSDWLEAKVDELPPSAAPLTDAVCYFSALNGRHGAFKRNIERVIGDPGWRGHDYQRQLRYHHGYSILAEHIGFHLISRKAYPHILCNDVGRVISVYPELAKRRAFADLCLFLKEQTIKSLAHADIKRSVRRGVEDIIERRAS